MTRADLVREICREFDCKEAVGVKAVRVILNTIKTAIENREVVKINNFGTFRYVKRHRRVQKTTGRVVQGRGWDVKFRFSGKILD